MRALMASEAHANGRGPTGWLRRHCKTIQISAAIALAFIAGMAVANHHVTEDALTGQANYFVHRYAPQVAAKAAGDAVRRAKQECPPGE